MKKIWIILGTSFGLLLISFLIWFFFFDIRIILVNGDSIVSTIYNDYHDPGIIIKQHNKEINPSKYQLTMINNVNKDLFGKYTASYEIKYRLRTFKLTREIIVTDDMNPLILADKEKITRDYCSHKILDKFTYTIYDNYDGEITDKGPYNNLSGDALWQAIRQERRVELAFEGLWYWDLRRWGDAAENYPVGLNNYQVHGFKIEATAVAGQYQYTYVSVDDKDRNFPAKMLRRFPLPDGELNSNALVDQYPEWN